MKKFLKELLSESVQSQLLPVVSEAVGIGRPNLQWKESGDDRQQGGRGSGGCGGKGKGCGGGGRGGGNGGGRGGGSGGGAGRKAGGNGGNRGGCGGR